MDFVDFGDQVLVVTLFHAQGKGSELPVEAVIYNVFTVQDGLIVQVRGSLDRALALKTAGLSE